MKTSGNGRRGRRTPALTAAFAVLRFLAESDQGFSLTAIHRGTGLNKSTCFSTLRQLERLGVAIREGTAYRLGSVLIHLGQAAARNGGALDLARPVLWRLRRETRLTAMIARPENGRLAVIETFEPTTEVHVRVPVGIPLHPTTGALGKCWLAFLPQAEARGLLEREGVPRFTARSHRSVESYRRDLERARRRGYADSLEEFASGVHAVAAPVFGPDHRVTIILGLAGFSSVLTRKRLLEAGARLRVEADRISAVVGTGIVPAGGSPTSPGRPGATRRARTTINPPRPAGGA